MVIALAIGGCGGSDKKDAEEPVVTDDDEPAQPVEQDDDDVLTQEQIDAIESFLARQEKHMARCWGDALEAKEVPASDAGKIALRFVIQPNGSISDLEIAEVSHKSKTLESCVLDKARHWKMPHVNSPTEYSRSYGFQRL
jgi:hypothetical protein